MRPFDINLIDFEKGMGLVPAIIQDYITQKVLMLGYMNKEALEKTMHTKLVTFYSRVNKMLWTKGDTSGNYLHVKEISTDCDSDTLLVKVQPLGPVCHTGDDTCWQEANRNSLAFITHLENIITERKNQGTPTSYISSLFTKGINAIAQKVGEEAIEMVIEAKDFDNDLFLNESADLLFHYLILLQAKDFMLEDVVKVLESRHK